jgi:hypothetical protein
MSKMRFVEFYLSAIMKAATNGRVSRLVYAYADGKRGPAKEYVSIVLEDRSSVPIPVTDCDLLGIALEVVKAVQKL